MNCEKLWGSHCGAVSLTFDDGRPSQLTKAVPPMNERGIAGTFYLCPGGDAWPQYLAPWREVAAAGHEIGNHTASHISSDNLRETVDGLEEMTIEQIEKDILIAQERLVEIAPHQQQWTFCYPCYCTYIGRGATRVSYVPVISKHFLAGRSRGEFGCANRPDGVDLSCVWGLSTDRMSGFEMIGLVEELTAKGHWVILIFHEIDGRRLSVASYDFNMLLDYLKRKENDIWTAPLVDVAEKVATFQSAQRGI